MLPSLSTLMVLLALLAMYSVPVEGSTACATGSEPVLAEISPLMLQPSEPWSPEATKIDCPSVAAAWKSVFSEFWVAWPTYASHPFVQLALTILAVSSLTIWLKTS